MSLLILDTLLPMFWPHTLNFCYMEIAVFTGGGLMTFVVDRKQERCSWVDDVPGNI